MFVSPIRGWRKITFALSLLYNRKIAENVHEEKCNYPNLTLSIKTLMCVICSSVNELGIIFTFQFSILN